MVQELFWNITVQWGWRHNYDSQRPLMQDFAHAYARQVRLAATVPTGNKFKVQLLKVIFTHGRMQPTNSTPLT